MTDLAQLSNDELLAIVANAQKAPAPKEPAPDKAAPDLSHLSNEDLLAIVQKAAGGGQGFDATRFDMVPKSGAGADALDAALRQKAEAQHPKVGAGEAALRGAVDWAGMGWGDEAIGGASALMSYLTQPDSQASLGDRYRFYKDMAENRSDAAWDQRPWAYGAGAVPGFLASTALTPTVRGANAVTTGLKTGALWGGISGAGQGDSLAERAGNAAVGAGIGAAGGAALGWVGDKASGYLTNRAAQDTAEEIGARAVQDQADPFGIPLSRGQRTGNVTTQAVENSMRNTAYGDEAQKIAQAFGDEQYRALGQAIDDINGQVAGADASGAAHPQIRQPHEAGTILRDAIDDRVNALRTGEDTVRTGIGDALGGGRRLVQNETDAAGIAAEALRSREERAGQLVDDAYAQMRAVPGQFDKAAVDGIDHWIKQGLMSRPNPVVVTREGTPIASAALDYLGNAGNFRTPINRADPRGVPRPDQITGFSADEIDRTRKVLNQFWRQAREPADRAAVGQIIQEFDNHIQNAVQDGLWNGDPRVLDIIRQARRMNAAYMQTFHPNPQENPVASTLRQILDRDATPEQVANYLFGSAKLGSAGRPALVADHLRGVLGVGSDEWNAVRQGGWAWMTRYAGDLTPKTAQDIASRIEEFTTNKGRSLANALYSQDELATMARYAANLRAIAGNRNTRPEALAVMMDIAQKNIQPQELATMLVGGQTKVGSSGTAGRLVDAVEGVFGRDSQEWSLLRQAVWRQVTTNAEGLDPKGAKQLANNLNNFLNGPGAPMAQRLFSDPEREQMQSFARIVRRVAGSADAKNPSNSANQYMRMAKENWRMVLASLGYATGDVTGAVHNVLVGQGAKMAGDALSAKRAERLFGGQRDLSMTRLVKDAGAKTGLSLTESGQRRAGPLAGHTLIPFDRAAAGEQDEQQSGPMTFRVSPGR